MSSKTPIPPPKNMTYLEKRSTIMQQILDAMGHDCWATRFDRFKAVIRDSAREVELDGLTRHEQENQNKWKKLVKIVVKEFPDLEKYQDHWPVIAYFNRLVADRVYCLSQKKDQKEKSRPDSNVDSDRESDDIPLSLASSDPRRHSKPTLPPTRTAGKRSAELDDDSSEVRAKRRASSSTSKSNDVPVGPRYYIGKNPSNFKTPALRKALNSATVLSSDDESDTDARCPRPSAATSSQVSSCPATQPSGAMTRTPSTPAQAQDNRNDWPYWCVWCKTGAPPTVPERYTKELRQLFPGDSVHTLTAMGILHDLHLRVLASIGEPNRRAFLLSFVPTKYTQFKALEMSDALNKFSKDHADEDFPTGEIQVCSKHANEHAVQVPSELEDVLQTLGMEELGPAAVFLGIKTNTNFQTARRFDAAARKDVFFNNMKGIQPSAFQNMMLEVALAAPL
ncbi:hypothetical protein B0H19DRAFT_1276035 [Mycena capillaripes]|nr:hypothetical protein B0H19DRAFT_1276035 [Mycena capillaripes]